MTRRVSQRFPNLKVLDQGKLQASAPLLTLAGAARDTHAQPLLDFGLPHLVTSATQPVANKGTYFDSDSTKASGVRGVR